MGIRFFKSITIFAIVSLGLTLTSPYAFSARDSHKTADGYYQTNDDYYKKKPISYLKQRAIKKYKESGFTAKGELTITPTFKVLLSLKIPRRTKELLSASQQKTKDELEVNALLQLSKTNVKNNLVQTVASLVKKTSQKKAMPATFAVSDKFADIFKEKFENFDVSTKNKWSKEQLVKETVESMGYDYDKTFIMFMTNQNIIMSPAHNALWQLIVSPVRDLQGAVKAGIISKETFEIIKKKTAKK